MGCTASALNHDQQQEWIRSQMQVADESVKSQKNERLQEHSLRSHQHKNTKNSQVFTHKEEALADDILDYVSKSNESEHTMYDGSCDGLSKADFSVVESTITRMGHSKSVATEDALYDDTSSDSENPSVVDAYQLVRYLNPIPIDVDDDLSRVDSMIASSEAPDLLHCDQSDDDSNFDQMSSGDTFITSSVAPDPLHSDDNDDENHKPIEREDMAQNSINQTTKATEAQLLPRKFDTSLKKSPAGNSTPTIHSPKRNDESKWEKPKNPESAEVDNRENKVKRQSSKSKLRPKPLPSSSSEKIMLKNDIARLRQQIQQLEKQNNARIASTLQGYMKPHDLIISGTSSNMEAPTAVGQQSQNDTLGTNSVGEMNYDEPNNATETILASAVSVGLCIDTLEISHICSDEHDKTHFDDKDKKDNLCKENIGVSTGNNIDDAGSKPFDDKEPDRQCKENDVDFVDSEYILANDETNPALVVDELLGKSKEKDADALNPGEICTNDEKYQTTENDGRRIEDAGSARNIVHGGILIDQNNSVPISIRRDSFDSTMMQYSVSTYGLESDFDQCCDDESTLLFGSSITKSTIEGSDDDGEQKGTSKAAPSVIVQTIPGKDTHNTATEPSIVTPVEPPTMPNVKLDDKTLRPIPNTDIQSQLNALYCSTNFEQEINDVRHSGHDSTEKSTSNVQTHQLKPAVEDDNAIDRLNRETTRIASSGHAYFDHDNKSESSMVKGNQIDGIKISIDASDFVQLLNMDPWNRESKLDEKRIFDMIEQKPSLCSQKYTFEGFHGCIYPLSALCALSASIAMIRKCYLAYPQAITKADAWVGTSLHYACSYHASLPIVEFLSKKHPLALKAMNQFNRLPLHMACMFDAEPSVISYLIRKYPGGCKKVDKFGLLPLHIACDSDIGVDSPNMSVIKYLVESYPQACMRTSEAGTTPLAISISRRVSLPVLTLLVEACPASLSLKDHKNRIPLHSAVLVRASIDVIALLVASYPNGLDMEDCKHETPYEYAVRLNFSKTALDLLKPPDRTNCSTRAINLQKIHIDQ